MPDPCQRLYLLCRSGGNTPQSTWQGLLWKHHPPYHYKQVVILTISIAPVAVTQQEAFDPMWILWVGQPFPPHAGLWEPIPETSEPLMYRELMSFLPSNVLVQQYGILSPWNLRTKTHYLSLFKRKIIDFLWVLRDLFYLKCALNLWIQHWLNVSEPHCFEPHWFDLDWLNMIELWCIYYC